MRFEILLTVLALAGLPAPAARSAPPQVDAGVGIQTLPIRLEQNRPYAKLTLTGPAGAAVKATFWLDTGGGAVILSGPLAKRLGLKPSGKSFKDEGTALAATDVPRISVGGRLLKLEGARAFMVINDKARLQGTAAEGAFPLRILRKYQVVIDYPRRELTIAEPGRLKPAGQPVAAHFGDPGFISITARVGDDSYGFLLDTGGQYCMVSAEVLAKWKSQHPDWRHIAGAYGPANMMLGPAEASFEMLRVGEIRLGEFTLHNVGAVSRPRGNYEKMMSRLTGRKVIGSIGGNLLRDFIVDIDYPNRRLYLDRDGSGSPHSLDMVGITLEPSGNGYVVAGVASGETVVRKGDRLLEIGGVPVRAFTTADLMNRLRGAPGDVRRLTIERQGKKLTVSAKAQTLL